MKNETGIHSMSWEEYRRSSRVNWSTLKLLDKSPTHYRNELVNPSPDTDTRQRGRAVHCAVWEPEAYLSRYVVWGGRRAGKEYEKFKAEHESFGREVITEGMDDAAKAISTAVRSNAAAAKYLVGAKAEQTMFWDHVVKPVGAVPGYTIRMKGRPDLAAIAMTDLKTTRSSAPDAFAKDVVTYGYHAQLALYVDGRAAATGTKKLPAVIIAAEAVAPYAVSVFTIPEDVLQLGREKYRTLLDRLNQCLETGHWPSYVEQETDLVLPLWANPIEVNDDTGMGLSFG